MALFRFDGDVLLNAPTYQAMAGVDVYVCSQPSNAVPPPDSNTTPIPPSPLAVIYSDVNGDPLSNPVTTDENGHYFFYIAPGTYDIVVNDPQGRLISTLVYQDQSIGVASGGGGLNFQTNGTANANQSLLNIAQGTGITAVNSGGTVTITNTGFVPAATNANLVYAGPATGSAATPTFRALVAADLPSAGGSTPGGVVLTNDLGGTATAPQVVGTHLASPLPVNQGGTAADLSATGGTSQVLKQATTGSAITVGQLAFTDISGTASNAQIPTPTTVALGGIIALGSPVSHQWVSYVDSTGTQNTSQPAFTDISGTLGVAQGGTGAVTLTLNGVVYGNGTSAVGITAQGGANSVLTANAGAPVFSATPTVTSLTTTGALVVGSTITTYNGLTTAGLGVAPTLVYSVTTPTTPVSATNLLGTAPAGLYEVTYYSVVTTAGVSGTSFALNFLFTDASGAQTIAAFSTTAFTIGAVNQGKFIIQNQSTNNIQYTITEVGSFSPHPVLALKLALQRIA